MKKILIIVCTAVIIALSGCGNMESTNYTQNDLENARLDGYKSGYSDGFDEGYKTAVNNNNKVDAVEKYDNVQIPTEAISADAFIEKYLGINSGTILSGKEYNKGSKITVTADWGADHVVLLKDTTGKEIVSFYVRAGDTVTIGVPAESLYVYFARGTEWHGYGKGLMFGDNTVYTKDDTIQDFSQYTYEYKLYPVNNGNFSEAPSNEKEFFE